MEVRSVLASVTPRKTYAAPDKAVAAFTKACAGWDGAEPMRYVLSVTEHGRYFVVALPSADQIQVSIALAYQGFAAVRT